ncbi:MAG TPA: hypothetical protein VHV52_05110 [Gaiellaceae bacterium]|nr:hypothetical protein [Gaiellaceae bacterium]
MTRPLAVVALAAALVASGCGGGHPQRKALTDYINRVNAVEKKLATRLGEVSTANQKFAGAKKNDPKLEAQLQASEKTMRTLSRRLAAIPAPPEAKHLRALLLELVNRQVELTHEVNELFGFVPAFQAALAPLAGADTHLKTELGRTAKTTAATEALDTEKAGALEAYAATVDAAIAELGHLQPPPVWRPGYTTQLASLHDLRGTALALAAAIRANHASSLPPLLERFDRAAVSDASLPAQKAQRAAVVAYNARIKALVTLARKVGAEQIRLQGVYG